MAPQGARQKISSATDDPCSGLFSNCPLSLATRLDPLLCIQLPRYPLMRKWPKRGRFWQQVCCWGPRQRGDRRLAGSGASGQVLQDPKIQRQRRRLFNLPLQPVLIHHLPQPGRERKIQHSLSACQQAHRPRRHGNQLRKPADQAEARARTPPALRKLPPHRRCSPGRLPVQQAWLLCPHPGTRRSGCPMSTT